MKFTPLPQKNTVLHKAIAEIQENIKILYANQEKLISNQKVHKEVIEDLGEMVDVNMENILNIGTHLGWGIESKEKE